MYMDTYTHIKHAFVCVHVQNLKKQEADAGCHKEKVGTAGNG